MKIDIKLLNSYLEKGLISRNFHSEFPLLIWNYTPKTQYERIWDNITLTCRTLVTDSNGNVVAKSFDKFFNIEEESEIPNEPFEVYEKLDGSLILVFWYNGALVVCSRSSFSSVHSEEARNILLEYDISSLNKEMSYSFELIVPWNKIVCDYGKQRSLVLLAKFDKEGNEHPISNYATFFQLSKKFEFCDLANLKKSIPSNEEGYVVRFKSGKRIKVKSDEYVKLHKLISNLSEKLILEIMSSSDSHQIDSFMSSLPDELYSWADKVKNKFETRFKDILDDCLSSFKHFPSRKDAAEYFLTQKYPHLLFAMLDKKNFYDMIWKVLEMEIRNELQQNN